jgi:hypothetical protein
MGVGDTNRLISDLVAEEIEHDVVKTKLALFLTLPMYQIKIKHI